MAFVGGMGFLFLLHVRKKTNKLQAILACAAPKKAIFAFRLAVIEGSPHMVQPPPEALHSKEYRD
jgi:hypothetical protein